MALGLRPPKAYRRGNPQTPIQVDFGHPSASGLANYWLATLNGAALPSRVPDLVGNSDLVIGAGTPPNSYLAEGLFSASGGVASYMSALITPSFAGPWSWDGLLRWDSSAAYGALSNANGSGGIYIKSTGKFNLYNGADQLSAGTLVSGNWYHLFITNTNVAAGASMYINGVLDTAGLSLVQTFAPNRFFSDNFNDSLVGVHAFQRYWRRIVSPTEVQQLYVDPWMLRSPQIPVLVNAAAPTPPPPPPPTPIAVASAVPASTYVIQNQEIRFPAPPKFKPEAESLSQDNVRVLGLFVAPRPDASPRESVWTRRSVVARVASTRLTLGSTFEPGVDADVEPTRVAVGGSKHLLVRGGSVRAKTKHLLSEDEWVAIMGAAFDDEE